MEKKFLTPKEVCQVLGIAIPTFYRYLKAGDIPPADVVVGCSNRKRWNIDNVIKFMENKGKSL